MTEHGAEEFRLAFEGHPCKYEADRIRKNDPAQTELWPPLLDEYFYRACLPQKDACSRLLGTYIATNEHLETLEICDSVFAIDALFEGLRGSHSLTRLGIASRLSVQSVQSMLPFLMNAPKLKKLELELESASLRAISRALNGSCIEELSLVDSDFVDVSAIGSCILPNLKCLLLSSCGMTSFPSLHGFPQLSALILYGNKINKEGFLQLNDYLASDSCQLRILSLGDTGMADEAISSLTRTLKFNRSVAELNLKHNDCGEAGYRSILKMVLDISSIKATLESNTCLCEINLPKESDFRDESDSDYDGSEYNTRDGFEEIRSYIHHFMSLNRCGTSLKERVAQTHLETQNRRQLCRLQGVDYSYGSIFAEIPTCVLPELFVTLWEDPDEMDPFRALVATVTDWTSLVDRRLMVEASLERNRALIKQLTERNLELEAMLKVELSGSKSLAGSKRRHGQVM